MTDLPKEISLFEIRFNSNLVILDLLQPITDQVCKQLGFEEDDRYWIWLAIQEGLNNAIKHGNKMNPEKFVEFQVKVLEGEFRITIQDEGDGFDPSIIPNPTDKENLLKTSGRGIFYMRSFMDTVEYQSGQGTRVTMVKKRETT